MFLVSLFTIIVLDTALDYVSIPWYIYVAIVMGNIRIKLPQPYDYRIATRR